MYRVSQPWCILCHPTGHRLKNHSERCIYPDRVDILPRGHTDCHTFQTTFWTFSASWSTRTLLGSARHISWTWRLQENIPISTNRKCWWQSTIPCKSYTVSWLFHWLKYPLDRCIFNHIYRMQITNFVSLWTVHELCELGKCFMKHTLYEQDA